MDELKSKVYIKVDEAGHITAINGGYTKILVTSDMILIDEGQGDKYNLCQTHYLDKPLINESGAHQYIYDNGKIREASAAEIEADTPDEPVSDSERLEAQVMYTALMTDTLLETEV